MKKLIMVVATLIYGSLSAQLYIERGGELQVEKGAVINVSGDIDANESIKGDGTIILDGSVQQEINMHGNYLPGLVINNAAGARLTGEIKLNGDLSLTGSRLQLDGFVLELSSSSFVKADDASGILTNKGGLVRKMIDKDLQSYKLPLFAGNYAAPVVLNSSARYSSAFVELAAIGEPSANMPADAKEFIQQHWKIDRNGINGTLSVQAMFTTAGGGASLEGYIFSERNLRQTGMTTPMAKSGNVSAAGSSGKYCSITASVPERQSELFAMTPFRLRMNSLSPNPAVASTRLLFNANLEGRGQLMISDSRGRLVQVRTVLFRKGENQINISLGNLSKGYYDVTVLNSGSKTTFRLVKQ